MGPTCAEAAGAGVVEAAEPAGADPAQPKINASTVTKKLIFFITMFLQLQIRLTVLA
jgi:hypothetical protein